MTNLIPCVITEKYTGKCTYWNVHSNCEINTLEIVDIEIYIQIVKKALQTVFLFLNQYLQRRLNIQEECFGHFVGLKNYLHLSAVRSILIINILERQKKPPCVCRPFWQTKYKYKLYYIRMIKYYRNTFIPKIKINKS